jgi:hypothetical protein
VDRSLPALEAEQRHRHRPAPVDLPDNSPAPVHARSTKTSLKAGLARDVADRPDVDARLVERDEQHRDPAVRGHVPIRPREDEHPVRLVRTGRPELLLVEHPLLTVALGAQRERRQVGPGSGSEKPCAKTYSPETIRGRKRRRSSGADHRSMVLPSMLIPKASLSEPNGIPAPVSSTSTISAAGPSPAPPYSAGHIGATQPRSASAARARARKVTASSSGRAPMPVQPGGTRSATSERTSARNAVVSI